jgi:hypothetical protein
MADLNTSTNDNAANCVRALIESFRPVENFGTIRAIDSKDIPAPFYSLLAHHSHMTVAMEAFHGHSVSLDVVSVAPDETAGQTSYTREILLRSPIFNDKAFGVPSRSGKNQKKTNRVVQYGIVRINTDRLPQEVVARIEEGDIPLGRILIEADLHREVRCVCVFEVMPGAYFGELCLGSEKQAVSRTFGRFATISISEQPVIELFEVVVPAAE